MKAPPIFEFASLQVGADGRRRRTVTTGFREIDANYWRDWGYAPSDYRYHAWYEYLLESPSFLAVQAKLRGEPSPHPMPSDWKKIEPVARDFIEAHEDLIFHDWWRKGGLRLFATRAPQPGVTAAVGRLTEKTKSLRLDWDGNDGVVIRIALNQSRRDAEKQLSKLLDKLTFDVPVREAVAPKYVFMNSRLRRSTLEAGQSALFSQRIHNQEIPLWWIGNSLKLIVGQSFSQEQHDRLKAKELAERKRLLAIAATRLIRTAGYVAENAARGRFPCADPFPEANTEFFRRKAGRPRKEE